MPDDPQAADQTLQADEADRPRAQRKLDGRFKSLVGPLPPSLLSSARRALTAVLRSAAMVSADLREYASLVAGWQDDVSQDPDPQGSDILLAAVESPTPYLALLLASRLATGQEAATLARLHVHVLLERKEPDKRFLRLSEVMTKPRGHVDRRVLAATRSEDASRSNAPRAVIALVCEALAPLPSLAPVGRPEPRERPPVQDAGFFETKRRVTRFQARGERAGVLGGQHSLCPAHARHVFTALAGALRQSSTARVTATVYMSVMLGVSPSRFRSIPLRQQSTALCWLDLDAGFFVYSLPALVRAVGSPSDAEDDDADWTRDDRQYMRVPIDQELLAVLRRQPSFVMASTLAELLGIEDGNWRQEVKDLLRPLAMTSWPVTLTSLLSVGPRLGLAVGRDETMIDALHCHAGLGPVANYHYRAFDQNEVADAAGVMWRALGLTGVVATPPHVAWLVEPPTELTFRSAAHALLEDADRLIRSAASALPAAKTLDLVGEVALLIVSVLVLLTGHRGTRIQDLTRNCVFLEADHLLALGFVAEKYAEKVRAVPLVGVVRRAVEAYIALLRSVAYRLRDDDPRLANAILARVSRASSEALFFRIDNGDLVDIVSKDVAGRLNRFGLRRNDGRRVMPVVSGLRGPLAVLVGIWMGRADAGQDGLGLESTVVMDDALQAIQAHAQAGIAPWQLPQLHVLHGRWSAKECDTTQALSNSIRPVVIDGPRSYTIDWDPPLRRDDPVRYVLYGKVCKSLEREPPKDPLVLASLLMVVRAGACNPHDVVELAIAAARGTARLDNIGRIYVRGEPADTRLGLRELIGAPELAAAVARTLSNPAVNDLRGRIDAYLAQVLGCRQDDGLALLCDCASAVMFRFAPRCVGEHARGAMTGRLATLATRALNVVSSSRVSESASARSQRARKPAPPSARETQLELQPLLNACKRYEDGQGSQDTRKKEFRAEVAMLSERLSGYSLAAQVMMLTANRMAAKGDAGSTVERQVVGELRGFLAEVAEREPAALTSLGSLKESGERLGEIAREMLAQRANAGTDADNLRAVLGHMRVACDVTFSLGETPAPAGSSSPVPCVWHPEVFDDVRRVLLSMDPADALRSRALASLALMQGAASLRANEAHGLRACDVAFLGGDVVLSIANPRVNIKSSAGRREIQVPMICERAEELRSVVESLRAAGLHDALLFGETAGTAGSVHAQDVRAVLELAFGAVVGDASASTLTLRRSAASAQLLTVLLPHDQRNVDFLERRQGLFPVAIGVGHASVWTTLTDYFTCMADVLFAYMARRPRGWSVELSAIPLLSMLTDATADAAAQRVNRHRSRAKPLIYEKEWSEAGRPLSELVAVMRADDARSRSTVKEDREARLRFLANVQTGITVDVAKRLDCVLEDTALLMKRMERSFTPTRSRLSDGDRSLLLPIAEAIAPLPDLAKTLEVLLPAGAARGASFVIVGEQSLNRLTLVMQALATIRISSVLRLSSHATDAIRAAAASSIAKVDQRTNDSSAYADVVMVTFASPLVRGSESSKRLRALICAALLDLVHFSDRKNHDIKGR